MKQPAGKTALDSYDMDCPLCGKQAQHLKIKWYEYDNGEQFRASVCATCADIHHSITTNAKAGA